MRDSCMLQENLFRKIRHFAIAQLSSSLFMIRCSAKIDGFLFFCEKMTIFPTFLYTENMNNLMFFCKKVIILLFCKKKSNYSCFPYIKTSEKWSFFHKKTIFRGAPNHKQRAASMLVVLGIPKPLVSPLTPETSLVLWRRRVIKILVNS